MIVGDTEFDVLVALAVNNPKQFEAERTRLLEAEIRNGTEWQQAKARRLLAKYETMAHGQDRLEIASIMMLESVNDLHHHLKNLTGH